MIKNEHFSCTQFEFHAENMSKALNMGLHAPHFNRKWARGFIVSMHFKFTPSAQMFELISLNFDEVKKSVTISRK